MKYSDQQTLPLLFSEEFNELHTFLKLVPEADTKNDILLTFNNCSSYSILNLLRATSCLKSYSKAADLLQMGLVISTIRADGTHYFDITDSGKIILKKLIHKLTAQQFLDFLRDLEEECHTLTTIKNAVDWAPSDQWATIISIMTKEDEVLKHKILEILAT